jgi:hypothetical protein
MARDLTVRGAFAITKFRAIGRQVWCNREPNLPDVIA